MMLLKIWQILSSYIVVQGFERRRLFVAFYSAYTQGGFTNFQFVEPDML